MTKKTLFAWTVLVSFASSSPGLAAAQETSDTSLYKTPPLAGEQQPAVPATLPAGVFKPQGTVVTPASSVSEPGKANTNYKLFVPAGRQLGSVEPDYTFAETPASLGCVYRAGPVYPGCNPATGTGHPTGGWGAIALVDAYDYPQAASDLATFDTRFGLGNATFKTIYANSSFGTLNGLTASCSGTPPLGVNNGGWDVEEALDIEWAHAMAPDARVFLIEACTNSPGDLLFAEEVAGVEIAKYGGGDISNSWQIPEFPTEATSYDNYFYRYYWSDITYFASSGATPGVAVYPSASPWVISTGGTTINRDVSGNFLSESCFAGSGGGFSKYETFQNPPDILNGMGPWTPYQYQLFGASPNVTYRSTPDISFDADPNSGVYVYDSNYGWIIVGGTSVSSPSLAGIVNASDNRLGQASSPTGGYYQTSELNLIYASLNAYYDQEYFYYDVPPAGYDQCSGVGSPRLHYAK